MFPGITYLIDTAVLARNIAAISGSKVIFISLSSLTLEFLALIYTLVQSLNAYPQIVLITLAI